MEIYRKDKNGRFTISYHLGYIEDEACKHCQKEGTEKKLGLIEVTDNLWNDHFPSKVMGTKNTFSDITYLIPESKEYINSIDGFISFNPPDRPKIRDIMCVSCFKDNDQIPKSNFIKEVAEQRDIIAELNQTYNDPSPQAQEKKEHNPFIKNENNIISINEKKYWYGLLSVLRSILPKDERIQSKIQSTSCEKANSPIRCQGDDPDQLIMLLNMNGSDFDVVESICKRCIIHPKHHKNFSILTAILSDQDLSDSCKISMLHKLKDGHDLSLSSDPSTYAILPRLASDILRHPGSLHNINIDDNDNDILAVLLTSEEMAKNGFLTTKEIWGYEGGDKIFWDNSDGKHTLYLTNKSETEKRKYDLLISKCPSDRLCIIAKEDNSYQQLPESTRENIPLLKKAKVKEFDTLIGKEREKLNAHWPDLMQRGPAPKQENISEPDQGCCGLQS